MVTVAVAVTKIHNVTHWCTLFNSFSRKHASQNVHRWDQNVWVSKCLCPCWKAVLGTSANRSTSLQIRKLRTQGLSLRIWELISFRNHSRIGGKKIEIYGKSANQQYQWDRFCNFQKNTFTRFNVPTDLGQFVYKVPHPLTKFLCCDTIIFQRSCYSYSKMRWLKVKKLPKSCTRRLWWHAQHVW